MSKVLNLANQQFGQWTVLSRADNNKQGESMWWCHCSCGTEKSVLGCALVHHRTNSCAHCANAGPKARQWKGGRSITNDGYVMLTGEQFPGSKKYNTTQEHVIVMARHLGRPLLPNETVHHKNGIRDDNRWENLELWTHPQPAGCRVSDQVEWATKILTRYAPERLTVW